jgi:preprotein translocase subunit SecD
MENENFSEKKPEEKKKLSTLATIIISIIIITSGIAITFSIVSKANEYYKLKNINPQNLEIKYGKINEWTDSGINAKNIKKISGIKFKEECGVQVEFDKTGKQIFYEITSKNIGKQIGLFIKGELISAPTINSEINNGSIIITNNYTIKEASKIINDILN